MSLGHRQFSSWYFQLAQQLEAGLPLAQALRSSHGTGAPAAGLESMAAVVERGGSVDAALHAAASWLPSGDRLALSAAATAGKLPLTLHSLAARHAQIGSAKQRVAVACLYPIVVLHVGILLFPITRMIDWEKGFLWNVNTYARHVALGLLPLWAIIGTLLVLAWKQHPALTRIARLLPALGSYVRSQALADFAFTLGNLLSAGMPIGRAWAATGSISRSPQLQAAATAMEITVAEGHRPGQKLAAWPCFPPEFAALYRTGEETGQLEANLGRLATLHQEAANRALTRATFLYPALLSLIVAGGVVYFVVTFYAGYLKTITGMAE